MQKISFKQYNEWLENHPGIIEEDGFFDDEEAFEDEGVQFHQGNLSIDILDVSPCVVVDGNLDVKDEIIYQFDRGLLVVNGDLKCKNFDFPFPTVVTGNMHAQNICINSCCDYWLTVGGDIHANSVIENGHCIKVLGNIYAPTIKSLVNELTVGGKKVEISNRD